MLVILTCDFYVWDSGGFALEEMKIVYVYLRNKNTITITLEI